MLWEAVKPCPNGELHPWITFYYVTPLIIDVATSHYFHTHLTACICIVYGK